MALQKIDKFLGVEESLGMSSQYYSEHLKKHNLPHEKIFLLLLLHNLTFRICAVYHSFALCHLQRQWQKAAELPHWTTITGIWQHCRSHPSTHFWLLCPGSWCPLMCCIMPLCSHTACQAAVTHPKMNLAKSKEWLYPGPFLCEDCMKTGAGSIGMRRLSPLHSNCAVLLQLQWEATASITQGIEVSKET